MVQIIIMYIKDKRVYIYNPSLPHHREFFSVFGVFTQLFFSSMFDFFFNFGEKTLGTLSNQNAYPELIGKQVILLIL